MKRSSVPRHAAKRHQLQQTPTSEDDEVEDPYACGSSNSNDNSYQPQTSESSDVESDTDVILKTSTLTPTPTDHDMPSTSRSSGSSTMAVFKPRNRSLGESGTRLQKFFQIKTVLNNDKVGTCNVCNKQIKMKNANNTGLKRHLSARHNKQYLSLFPPSNINNDPQQQSIVQMLASKNQVDIRVRNTMY